MRTPIAFTLDATVLTVGMFVSFGVARVIAIGIGHFIPLSAGDLTALSFTGALAFLASEITKKWADAEAKRLS